MAGKGGGAWKVAYADFVTAMMAFFLVMWLVSQNDEVKEAIAHYFEDPYGFSMKSSGTSNASLSGPELAPSVNQRGLPTHRRSPKGERGHGAGGGVKSSLKVDPDKATSQKPTLVVLHSGTRAAVGAFVPFADHSVELDDRGKERLQELLPAIVGKPNKIEIRAHVTGQPLPPNSPYADAWQLCYARCLATMKYLVDHGIDAERLRLSQAGPYEPFTTRMDADSQGKNSRVEVYVLAEFTQELVGSREEQQKQLENATRPPAASTGAPLASDAAAHVTPRASPTSTAISEPARPHGRQVIDK